MPLTAGLLVGLLAAALGLGRIAVGRKHGKGGLALTALGL